MASKADAAPKPPKDEGVFKPGHYQVQVHVIEARDIKSATPSPRAVVSVMDQKKSTPIIKDSFSPFFDHLLFWEFSGMNLDNFEYGKISINLFDTNTALRAKLIGSYEFDLMQVYNSPNHEIYKQWVALTDPSDKNEGIQALMKLTLSVLGPGDDPVPHDEVEEEEHEDENSVVLVPPRMKTQDHLLVIQVHRAEHLPNMDFGMFGQGGGLDPYIAVEYAGIQLKLKVPTKYDGYDCNNPIFNKEFQIPVTMPTMTDRIVLRAMDYDSVGGDDLIASAQLRFSELPCLAEDQVERLGGKRAKKTSKKDKKDKQVLGGHRLGEGALTRWVTLYGPRGKGDSGHALKMRKGLAEGSTYLGRVLVSCFHYPHDEAKKAVESINSLPDSHMPASVRTVLRFNVMQGAQLPYDSSMSVEVSWGTQKHSTKAKVGTHGLTKWYEELPEIVMMCPPRDIPDVFVYLKKGDDRIAYRRLSVHILLSESAITKPVWGAFYHDKCFDAFPAGKMAGELLFGVEMRKEAEGEGKRERLVRPSFMPCTLYTYLYRAIDLPPIDVREGSIDPYIVVAFCGASMKFDVVRDTCHPQWNKMQKMQVDVIQPPELAPKINVIVMDYDDASGDDLAGGFRVPASEAPAQFHDPCWYDLLKDGQPISGKVLMSFQLVPMMIQSDPPASILPPMEERIVEFTILGLRNLSTYNFIKIQNPCVEVTLGDKKLKTKTSKWPSGTNPNFLECLTFALPLPSVPIYAPPLLVSVYDDRLISRPKVATATILLEEFWQSKERKRTAFIQKDDDDDEEEGGGPRDDQVGAGEDGEGEEGAAEEAEGLLAEEKEGTKLLEGVKSDATPREGIELAEVKGKEKDKKGGESDSDSESDNEAAAEKAFKEDIDNSAKYMKGRKKLDCELEDFLKVRPFHEVQLVRAAAKGEHRKVGLLKGNVFIVPAGVDPNAVERPFSHTEFKRPKHYLVRVYIIRGVNLTAKDSSGLSDPVLRLSLGRKTLFDRESLRTQTINPEFRCAYELNCILPGQSHLEITVLDSDTTGYDVIGSTSIDLENYFFCEEWHAYEHKPMERRTLWSPLTPTSQGCLEMWVDILDPRLQSVLPMVDISPPPKRAFEMRVIVWKAEGIIAGDYVGNLSDMYVSVELRGKDFQDKKDTDVHWRAPHGKGSFNYRVVMDIELPMKKPRLTFQVWDQDIISGNDALGEVSIRESMLRHTLTQAYQTSASTFLRSSKKKDHTKSEAQWLAFHNPNVEGSAGRVLVEVEFLPKEVAARKPAGEGRSDPNSNPYLPPPARMEWNLLRPDLMIKKLIGPDLYARLKNGMLCMVCCFVSMFFLYFLGQFASIVGLFV